MTANRSLFAGLLALAACATEAPTPEAKAEAEAAARYPAAYDRCLRDNMAAAVAWEMIEAMCREKTGASDPLGAEE